MTDKELDDLFKKRLNRYRSPVPEDMWMRITRDKKERRTTFLFRWSSLFLLMIFTGFTGWYLLIYNNHFDKNEISKSVKAKRSISAVENRDRIQSSKNGSSQNSQNPSTNHPAFTVADFNIKSKIFEKHDKKVSRTFNKPAMKKDIAISNRSKDDDLNIAGNTTDDIAYPETESIKSKSLTSKDSVQKNGPSDVAEEDTKETTNDRIALELYVSPQLPINNITSGNSGYEQLLKKSVQARLSYSIGARFSVSITKQLSGKIGVVFEQITEKVMFTDSALSTSSVYNNHYKSVNIPILFTYQLPSDKTINTSFTTGVLLNVHSSYKGTIPSVRGETLDINKMNVYNSNTGARVYISVSLSKKMSNNLSIFAEPYFSYPLKNMADNFQSFKQRINTVGVSLGVKYNLID